MDAPDDRAVLTKAVATSVSLTSGSVGIAGLALLLLGGFFWLLLGWFADGECVCSRLENLAADACALTGFIVLGALFARLVFAVAGGWIMQDAAGRITGRPSGREEWPRAFRQVVTDFVDIPLSVFSSPLLFAVVLAGLLQLTRIPYVGPVLLIVLLPVLVYLAIGITRPVIRWLLSGHLIGAALATEPSSTFPAQSTAFAYLAKDGLRVVGLRIGAFLLALGAVLLRAAAIAVLALALCWLAPGVATGTFGMILGAIAAWWLLSLLVSACWSARVAQYVVLRRSLDGVALAGSSDAEVPEDLEEMGLALVKRLRSEEE